LTVVKTIRAFAEDRYSYIIMVTARREKSDVAISMQAGVDSFMTKPVDADRLKAGLRVARRIMSLQEALEKRVKELEEAQSHVQMLQGFLPICAYCKNIRDDQQLWKRIDEYITEHQSSVQFSHSICPDCFEKHVKPMQNDFFKDKAPAV
jgi:CheY-like chemotaxis protein